MQLNMRWSSYLRPSLISSLLFVVTSSFVSAANLPPKIDTPAFTSPIGVGAYARFSSYGVQPVRVDIGCALHASSSVSLPDGNHYGVNERDAALMVEATGKFMRGYLIPNLGNPSGPKMIALDPTNESSQYQAYYQHLSGIQIVANTPLVFAGVYNAEKAVEGLSLIWISADGSWLAARSLQDGFTEFVAPRCISAPDTSAAVVYTERNPVKGYFIYKYGPSLTPLTAEDVQDARVGSMLSARAAISELEKLAVSKTSDIADMSKKVRIKLMSTKPSESSDLATTLDNITRHTEEAAKAVTYDKAYGLLKDAQSTHVASLAMSESSDARSAFVTLGTYLNSAELAQTSLQVQAESQKAIDLAGAERRATVRRVAERRSSDFQKHKLYDQVVAERASADAAAERNAAATSLRRLAAQYPAQLGSLVLRFARLPDRIGNDSYDGRVVVTWTFGSSTYYIEKGIILGRSDTNR